MTFAKWIYNHTNQFKKDYKNLRDTQIQEKVNEGIKNIMESDYPRQLGIHKVSNIDCIYGYEIGRRYRILYEVFDEQGKKDVIFYRVGLHNIYRSSINRIKPSEI